ncbi:snRNA-activating protein complex subunit 1 [Discoglossus pictus]
MSYAGLKVDIETLLGRFQETDSVRFEEFSAIWRDMKFSTIFCGGLRSLERNKFTREALSVACFYFLPPYTFQIRVGALYLLYGLYNTQRCKPKQKIRIALKDWNDVETFCQDLITAQHFDAAYIFRQMRLSRAFYYTAVPVHLTFRTQKNGPRNIGKEEFKDVRDRVSDLVTSETLEEMLNIHEHYRKTKCLVSADKSQPDKSLSLVKEEFVGNLKDFVTEYQQWKLLKNKPRTKNDEEKEKSSQESEGSERARALAKIKSKSYSAVIEAPKSRRHRQVQMGSSESGGDYGKTRRRKSKRPRKRATGRQQTARSKNSEKPASPSKIIHMPVIPEEGSSSGEEAMPAKKRRKRR